MVNLSHRNLYGVIGNPVAHSQSPVIHTAFSIQTGQALRYERVYAPIGGFANAVRAFREENGLGLNVTLPFKPEAYALSHTCTDRARRAGAVNTLRFDGDATFGDNTDGVGLVRDLERWARDHAKRWERARVLVLGAGGAARGILGPLLDFHPEVVVVANRTEAKAYALAQLFGADAARVRPATPSALEGQTFDLVINATSAGLEGGVPEVPELILRDATLVYDLCYPDTSGSDSTAFLRLARMQGAVDTADGLGMLVEQAAESFWIWHGVRPNPEPVLAALRASL